MATKKYSSAKDLSKHRLEKAQERTFEEFISQVTTDLKQITMELAKAQGILTAFASYLEALISKLTGVAPKEVIENLTNFHDTVSNISSEALPTATDTVMDTVNQLQEIISSITHMNLEELVKK